MAKARKQYIFFFVIQIWEFSIIHVTVSIYHEDDRDPLLKIINSEQGEIISGL